MNKFFILPLIAVAPLCAAAQNIDFELGNTYRSIGVYDSWEESPFRTGQLKGNAQVVDNFLKDGNPSSKIVGIQRSRYGSNTFGVRIDLNKPFMIGPDTLFVHVKINKPIAGKVMLIGLGKRIERHGQSPETEQFWVYSENTIVPNRWNDAVFPVRGYKGIEIHSLVVIPDCSSPHDLKADFAAYIDDIEVSSDNTPRINLSANASDISSSDVSSKVSLHAGSRNGYITDSNGKELISVVIPKNSDYRIKATPAPGFSLDYILIKSRLIEKKVSSSDFDTANCFTIPADWITDDITIEGEFKSIDK